MQHPDPSVFPGSAGPTSFPRIPTARPFGAAPGGWIGLVRIVPRSMSRVQVAVWLPAPCTCPWWEQIILAAAPLSAKQVLGSWEGAWFLKEKGPAF